MQSNAKPRPVDTQPLPPLYKLKTPDQVSAGDTVYEIVRFGVKAEHVKHNPCRVRRVEREACTVQRPDGKVVKIHFRQLMCSTPIPESAHEREAPPLMRVEESEPSDASADDPVRAWMDMGKGLLDELERDRLRELERREARQRELDALLAQQSDEIARLEARLREARQRIEAERIAGRAALEAHEREAERIAERRKKLEAMLGRVES